MKRIAVDVVRFLRNGAWLTPERVRGYSVALITASLAVVVWLFSGHGANDPMGRPIGTDFLQFWSASWALLHGQTRIIYDPAAFDSLERRIFHREDSGFFAFIYPPSSLLLVWPLAYVPYLWAWFLWIAVGLGAYLWALWHILPGKMTLLVGLAFPAVLLVITHGQPTVILTPILAFSLLLIDNRPVLAGLLLGLISFKPQLAPLIPLALLAGGYWRTLLSAGVSLFVILTLSVALFGAQMWTEFFGIMNIPRQVLDEGLISPYFKLQSVFSAARLLGGSLPTAYIAQATVSLVAAGLVVGVWRQSAIDQGLKNAALLAAIPLCTPYFMDYDFFILGPAIAWQARAALRNGFLPWEATIIALAYLIPLFARSLAEFTRLEPAPLVACALFISILVRAFFEPSRRLPEKPPHRFGDAGAHGRVRK